MRGSDMQIVVFRVGVEHYALPTSAAREVINYEQPRRLPGADPWVQGVINLRGEIIPVCDLAHALGLADTPLPMAIVPDDDLRKTVICDSESGSVGLVVDEVSSVVTIESDTLERPRSLSHPALAGVIRLDDRLIVLLELEHVLGGEALTTFSEAAHDAPSEAEPKENAA